MPKRPPSPSVAEMEARIAAAPRQVQAFQAIRLLEAAGRAAQGGRAKPRLPVGQDSKPKEEAARLAAPVRPSFAPSDLEAIEPGQGAKPAVLTLAMFGLNGPSSVLPPHLNELLMRRRRLRDNTLADFFNLFNHRSLSFFYRAWRKYRVAYELEAAQGSGADAFSQALTGLTGVTSELAASRTPLGLLTLLGYAGHLSRKVRSGAALESALRRFLGQPVSVLQLQPGWIAIPQQDRSRLPRKGDAAPAFNQLDRNVVLGAMAPDVQSRFQLRIGPMDFETFRSFFRPDGPRAPLEAFVRLYAGPAQKFSSKLVLRKEEVPYPKLDPADPPRLGQDIWLKSEPHRRDLEDAVLEAR